MNSLQNRSPQLYRIVVSHYVAAALCFLVLSAMLCFSISDFSGHYFQPRLLALTHLAVLGWASTIIFGACYQLIPVVFETGLCSYKLPWISFLLFLGGTTLLVFAFWTFDPGLPMQAGGLMIVLASLLFNVVVIGTARRNRKPPGIYQEMIVTSCLWLLATTMLGFVLVLNFRYAFLSKDHLHFLKLHAHMGIAGWFLLLVVGVSAKLLPMFLVSRGQSEKLLNYCYNLINAGLLLFLIDTFCWGLSWRTYVIGALVFAGVLCYFFYVKSCFVSRLKRRIELPITNTIISFILLGLAVVVLPLIVYYHLKGSPSAVLYTNMYGSLLFMGWISSLILGQTFKTLPFIVWARRYEHLVGKIKTPLPADLYNKALLMMQTLTYAGFCIAFFCGLVLRLESLTFVGSVLLLITALTYNINIFIILKKYNYDLL